MFKPVRSLLALPLLTLSLIACNDSDSKKTLATSPIPVERDTSTSNLICLSNGEYGGYEKFQIYNIKAKETLSAWTRKLSCEIALDNLILFNLTCLSNGEDGGYEDFQIYDHLTGKNIGTWTSEGSCISSINGLIEEKITCISNGEDGGFERFKIYDHKSNETIGTWTSKESCEFTIAPLNIDTED